MSDIEWRKTRPPLFHIGKVLIAAASIVTNTRGAAAEAAAVSAERSNSTLGELFLTIMVFR